MKEFEPKKVLSDVLPQEAFWFFNGAIVRNIYELLNEIKSLDDWNFVYHSNIDHDDFAKWINDTLGDANLTEQLKKEKDRDKYVKKIEKRIKKLESIVYFNDKLINPIKKIPMELLNNQNIKFISLLVTVVLVTSLFLYTQSSYTKEIAKFEDQIFELKERDLILQRFLLQSLISNENLDETESTSQESPGSVDSFFSYKEKLTPQDRIKEEQIKVYENMVVIDLENASWAKFVSTGSMIPTLSEDANAIELTPSSPKEIYVGDIISYVSPDGEDIIIHRVVEIGEDEQGWYAITKGDNNQLNDPFKVRFEQIERVLIGIIY
ncbi:signal peptidase I [Candidatus Woesearchaeota archaeon RBG_13_36_6]|nr:MAG: signal peptidase I [Candidatus Woesearchaeota archaeon RBG_13_36_6]